MDELDHEIEVDEQPDTTKEKKNKEDYRFLTPQDLE